MIEQTGVAFGQEQCYRVRSASSLEPAVIEGEASPPQCVTPRDQFAPAAPGGLAAVPTAGQISLIWDANTETDPAGYLVMRGQATPMGRWRRLPSAEPGYVLSRHDREANVRYVYAIVAVDAATPPNTSPQSTGVEDSSR